ncbi:baseplate J/gp47 family protein [Citrobacter arsenatis]|uniref:baseplate J/gp47 family protein n=1 Tax=Citrobacter arsenatis TaxID=2546350 RepID=UPI00300E4A28
MPDLPVVVTQAGAQPTPPKTLLTRLIQNVAAKVPGYTANLPPGLIADLAGTATGAVALLDSAMCEAINAVTPYGANVPLLNQLGDMYGVTKGVGYNTSVYETFIGTPGFLIPKGFTISDGNHQYQVQNNTVVPSSGQTDAIYCLATQSGTWAVPAGSVTQIITSVPATISLSCTNLTAGIPGASEQPEWSYRSQVMQSGMSAAQGVPDFLKSMLRKVSGVKENLISYRQVSLGQWAVIVGGGDTYDVAAAIYQAIPDISVLTVDVATEGETPPNSVTVTIQDYPDQYDIPYIIPSSQAVTVILTWNTTSLNAVNPDSVAAIAKPLIIEYINSLSVGEPVNIYQIQTVFLGVMALIINPTQVSMIDIQIGINGVIVPPDEGTDLVYGDRYGYFTTDSSHVTVQKYGSTATS